MHPAADGKQPALAVDAALAQVLGEQTADIVYRSVGRAFDGNGVPAAQLILMWVAEQLPGLAERVLGIARTNYEAAAAT